MDSMLSRNPLPFDRPAAYQIRVQGRIDPTWSDRLEGMTISMAVVEEVVTITTLEGELSDQAALAGVLNSLYEQHLVVLSVERLSSQGKIVGQDSNKPKNSHVRGGKGQESII